MEWSHALLAPDLQRAFANFGVFAGGATVNSDMVVTGAGPDVLEALVARQPDRTPWRASDDACASSRASGLATTGSIDAISSISPRSPMARRSASTAREGVTRWPCSTPRWTTSTRR
jgi:hypothetical protein